MEDISNNSKTRKPTINNHKLVCYKCNLKSIRVALGLTQSDLAREIGKTSEFVNMIEHQKYHPILETKIKIARALKTDTSAIWIPIEIPEIKTAKQIYDEENVN